MPAQFNIPVPATPDTFGAPVDISAKVSALTLLCFGMPDDNLALYQSFDGVNYAFLAGITGGAQTVLLDAEGNWIKAKRLRGSSGAYNLQAAEQGLGIAAAGTIAVPATTGFTAGVDISGQPVNMNVFFDGSSPGRQIGLEQSFDNANYAPVIGLSGGEQETVSLGSNWLRVNRFTGGTAGTLRFNGVPAKGV